MYNVAVFVLNDLLYPFMNKQFALLALANVSLTLGSAPFSFANTVYVQSPSFVISKAEKPLIDVTKVSIGSLKLGMTEKQVTRLLGKPISIKKEKSDNTCYWSTSTSIKYRNLDIFIADDSLDGISTASKSYATKEGVRVGDPISKAKKIYGSKFGSEQTIRNQEKYSINYIDANYGGLSFEANQKGIITRISLLSQSC
jgi:outer membrane protein assembly factor BamE (lipoprotein component of BamABCDE complex)